MPAKTPILAIILIAAATNAAAQILEIKNITSYELADIVLTFEERTDVPYVAALTVDDSDFGEIDELLLPKKLPYCNSLKITGSRFGHLGSGFFWSFTGLKELVLDGDGLESMDFLYGVSTSLKKLDVKRNRIKHVEGLGRFKSLQFLDLSWNKLELFELNVTEYLYLFEIRASNNLIKILDKENFRYLKQLQTLDLSGNNIKQINNSTFSYLENLNALNLSICHIQILQPGVFNGLQNLAKLNIDHNIIEEFPDLSHLTYLQFLSVNDNKIQTLFDVSGLQLTEANFGNNAISKIIRSKANKRIAVNKLFLQNCTDGQFLPKLVDTFRNVVILDLRYNKLGTLKATAFNNSNTLRELNLENSFVTNFEENCFSGLRQLGSLILNRNNITILRDFTFNGLGSLQTLNISYCNVNQLEENSLFGLQRLHNLDLSFNNIEIIENCTFQQLTELYVLNLQGNKIKTINTQHFIKNLYLNFLHLTGIQTVEPNSFINLKRLTELVIGDSSFQTFKNETFTKTDYFQILTFENVSVRRIESGAFSDNKFLNSVIFKNSTIKEFAFKSFRGDHSNMKVLNLSYLGIETLESGTFAELNLLTDLDLRNNSLSVLKRKTFFGLTNLQVLYLQGNSKLISLESQIFSTVHKLQKLWFTCNHCKLHQYVFEELKNLKQLKFIDTVINFDQNAFEPLKSLTNFELINLKTINKLPSESFSGLRIPIKNLQMMFSNTQRITEGLFKGYEVKTLNLSRFELKSIHPNAFKGIVSTEFLDLSFNLLAEIRSNAFEGLNNLTHLNLSNNRIISLHKNSFEGLIELEYLDLSHNKLRLLPFGTLQTIPKVFSLSLGHNKIENLELYTFSNLNLLEILDISYLNMTELKESSIFPLQNLESLNIEGNGLIDVEFVTLTDYFKNLKNVSINGNKWSCEKLPQFLSHLRKRNVNYLNKDVTQKPNVDGIYCVDKCSFIYC